MTKVTININLKVKWVAAVALSLPLGLYGVFPAQPKFSYLRNKYE
jgi:hypothetical protein